MGRAFQRNRTTQKIDSGLQKTPSSPPFPHLCGRFEIHFGGSRFCAVAHLCPRPFVEDSLFLKSGCLPLAIASASRVRGLLAARGKSLPSPKRAEPARLLRCSSVKYGEY